MSGWSSNKTGSKSNWADSIPIILVAFAILDIVFLCTTLKNCSIRNSGKTGITQVRLSLYSR